MHTEITIISKIATVHINLYCYIHITEISQQACDKYRVFYILLVIRGGDVSFDRQYISAAGALHKD